MNNNSASIKINSAPIEQLERCNITHGSLFSGIGGFDLAAEWAGFENIFHCEKEDDKRAVLTQHFRNSKSYGDITEFDGKQYQGTIDVLSGGFPCQDISIAQQSKKIGGAKGIKGERSGLWREYARILGEIKPGIVIFEKYAPEQLHISTVDFCR